MSTRGHEDEDGPDGWPPERDIQVRLENADGESVEEEDLRPGGSYTALLFEGDLDPVDLSLTCGEDGQLSLSGDQFAALSGPYASLTELAAAVMDEALRLYDPAERQGAQDAEASAGLYEDLLMLASEAEGSPGPKIELTPQTGDELGSGQAARCLVQVTFPEFVPFTFLAILGDGGKWSGQAGSVPLPPSSDLSWLCTLALRALRPALNSRATPPVQAGAQPGGEDLPF